MALALRNGGSATAAGRAEFVETLTQKLPPIAPDFQPHVVGYAPARTASAATRALLNRTLEWIAQAGRATVPVTQPVQEWATDPEPAAAWATGCVSHRGTFASHDLALSGPKSEWRRRLQIARARVAADVTAAHLGAVLAFGVAYATAPVGGSKVHGCLSTYCAKLPVVWCAARSCGKVTG